MSKEDLAILRRTAQILRMCNWSHMAEKVEQIVFRESKREAPKVVDIPFLGTVR